MMYDVIIYIQARNAFSNPRLSKHTVLQYPLMFVFFEREITIRRKGEQAGRAIGVFQNFVSIVLA